MKFKEQYIYYGLCAVTAMLLIVAVINKREMKQHQLREAKKLEQSQEQKKVEEKDTGNAVIRVLIRGEGFQEELHEKVGITAVSYTHLLEERKKTNYDHPDAMETELLVEHLHQLKEGKAIECPVYDYTMHTRSNQVMKVEPKRVILLEGILVLADERLRNLMDVKVYVEADADERILRRVIRDVKERGRDIEGVVEQYLTTVKPMHYLYVEPTRTTADIVINSGMNPVAFELVRNMIQKILDEKEEV